MIAEYINTGNKSESTLLNINNMVKSNNITFTTQDTMQLKNTYGFNGFSFMVTQYVLHNINCDAHT